MNIRPLDPQVCRICYDVGVSYDRNRHRRWQARGEIRPLEARISDRVKVVGEMVLCHVHREPRVVTPDMWQPGARMVPM